MCYYVCRVLGKYCTKCAITCFVFWGSIAQNVLLRVSYFGEVLHKMYYYVFRVLGKYCTKCAITCFVFWGGIAQNVLLRISYFGKVSHK